MLVGVYFMSVAFTIVEKETLWKLVHESERINQPNKCVHPIFVILSTS